MVTAMQGTKTVTSWRQRIRGCWNKTTTDAWHRIAEREDHTMIRRRMTWGVFLFLFVLTAVMIFEPIHYVAAWAAVLRHLIYGRVLRIIIGYLRRTNEQWTGFAPLSKMQKNLAWYILRSCGCFSGNGALSIALCKFADKECAVVIDIWSALFGGVIGFISKIKTRSITNG